MENAMGMSKATKVTLLLFASLAFLGVLVHSNLPARGRADTAVPAPMIPQPTGVGFAKDVVPFLAKHCYHCHGNGKKRGELTLDRFRDEQDVQKDRKVWENVLQMIQTGEMPPKERPRPTAGEITAVVRSLDGVLARLSRSGPRNPGRVTLRRLNKIEYNNTIRDLVGVDFHPAADFPNDDVGYGFDNIGDVLSLSPLLLERYLAAADDILERAIVIADPPKPTKTRLGLNVFPGVGENRRGVGTLLYSRGSITGQTYFEEGDYLIKIEAFARQLGDEPVRASVRLGRTELVKEFVVKAEQAAPMTLELKTRLKAGTSRLAVSLLNPYRAPKSDESEKATPPPSGKAADPYADRRLLFVRSIVVEGPYDPPPVKLPDSHRRIMEVRNPVLRLALARFSLFGFSFSLGAADPLVQRAAAREIVTRFASHAFRRQVKPEEVDSLLRLYDKAAQEGERFENCIRLALCRVLVSPHFLFRVELDPPGVPPGTSYVIGEYELASRLSYFLWRSMPDDELFTLAAQGALRQNVDTQVQRMLHDPKAQAFLQDFADQWLTLRKLAYVSPDPKTFPTFDDELRAAMIRETELFFEAIVREDHSILDLLDGKFSFVNERLAKHYGIEGVTGKEFRRVTLPANRGGILTQASILTLTSNATRTSPVKRGKWVLDQVLNTPPPPPPPDVPELNEEKQLTGSLRKVLEQHRENALCASCHQRMDPIGFAFENYNAIGIWRDTDGKFPIDATGVLPDGRSFQGPAELKAILRDKKELFCRCLAEKLLTYALGRGLEYYDTRAVDQIVEALSKHGDRFSILLREVVHSDPFQQRTAMRANP